jgi:hypothetical protein
MHAYLINPTSREVSKIELLGTTEQIAEILGAKNVDFDEIGANGDRLYFDEDCFIKATPNDARFKVDNLAPVSGHGIICGKMASTNTLSDVQTALGDLTSRVQFL